MQYTFTAIGYIANGEGVEIPPENNGTDAWAAYQAWLDAGNTPAPYVPPPAPPEEFSKLDIRRAMRRLGIEDRLDALLAASAMFEHDWADSQAIVLTDPVTQQALTGASIDVAAVIAEIRKGE